MSWEGDSGRYAVTVDGLGIPLIVEAMSAARARKMIQQRGFYVLGVVRC